MSTQTFVIDGYCYAHNPKTGLFHVYLYDGTWYRPMITCKTQKSAYWKCLYFANGGKVEDIIPTEAA
jgi:hypothetical protein